MSRRLLAGVLIVFVLVLAACGDDGDSTDQADAPAADGGDGADGGGGDGGDGGSGDLAAAFTGDCAAAVQAFNDALVSATAAFNPNATATPEDTAALLDEVAAAAPDEIADDFQVLAEAYGEFAQALADSGVDFNDPSTFQNPETLTALNSLSEIFDEEELTQAADDIEAWFDANCAAA